MYDLLFTPDGMLWLASRGGLIRFDGREFTRYTRQEGLPDNSAFCLLLAKDGSLWVGTGEVPSSSIS